MASLERNLPLFRGFYLEAFRRAAGPSRYRQRQVGELSRSHTSNNRMLPFQPERGPFPARPENQSLTLGVWPGIPSQEPDVNMCD